MIKRPDRPKGLSDPDYKHLIEVAINHAIQQLCNQQSTGLQTISAQIAKEALESRGTQKTIDYIVKYGRNREQTLQNLLNPSSKKSSRSRKK